MKRSHLVATGGCIAIAIIAFVIGFVSRSTGCDHSVGGDSSAQSMSDKERDALHQSIVDLMKTEELKKNMQCVLIAILFNIIYRGISLKETWSNADCSIKRTVIFGRDIDLYKI